MDHHSVICLATSRHQAETIVEDLRMSDFSDDHISLILSEEDAPTSPQHAKTGGYLPGGTQFPELETFALPDGESFAATGPLFDAIRPDAAFCGIAGSLISIGIPEREARRYENRLHKGNILIAVHSEDTEEVAFARKILKAGMAEEICTSSAWSLACI
jgi:hypothetical protein